MDNEIAGRVVLVEADERNRSLIATVECRTWKQRKNMLAVWLRFFPDKEASTKEFNQNFEKLTRKADDFLKLKNDQQRATWLHNNQDGWIVKGLAGLLS